MRVEAQREERVIGHHAARSEDGGISLSGLAAAAGELVGLVMREDFAALVLGEADDEMFAALGSEPAVVAAAVERRGLLLDDGVVGVRSGPDVFAERPHEAIVQPSGQPISRSHSTGVSRRTDEEFGLTVVLSLHELLDAIGEAVLSSWDCANELSAFSSSVGSARPRFAARRRMPCAARADSENLGGALGCNTSRRVVGTASQTDDEDPSSPLRHSEVASVENPERHAIPEFDHCTEERRQVSPSMTREEARYVLEEDGGRSVSLHKGEEDIGEVGAGAFDHAAALSGDAEVLARKTAGPEASPSPLPILSGSESSSSFRPSRWTLSGVNVCATSAVFQAFGLLKPRPFGARNVGDVAEVRDSGPPLGEDS